MITRYALFHGRVPPGQERAFRQAVLTELLPTWQVYPGAVNVRVAFATDRDATAPDCPLILAVDFPDRDALQRALDSQERLDSRAETQRVLPGLFDGQIFHYVTESLSFDPVARR